MALILHVNEFNDDIHFTEAWHTWGVDEASQILFGEAPVPFNAYEQVLPHRGETDYNSGWVLCMQWAEGANIYYRIIYDATDDIGYFDIAGYSEGAYSGLRCKFDFTGGVDEDSKYLAFFLLRRAYVGSNQYMNAPGPFYIYMTQWVGTGYIGTWDSINKYYTYRSNSVQYNLADYYAATGPWVPTFPQTSETAWTQQMLPGVILRLSPGILWDIPETQYHGSYYYVYYGETYDPYSSIKNAQGEGGETTPDDPNEGDPGGPSKPGGGDGGHQPHYDPIPVPPLPTIGPNSAGFVYMLRMDTTTMQTFAADLVRPSWWEALKAFFADPMDFICGIMIVPYQPDSNRNITPRFGDNHMLSSFPQVSQQYKKIDCGSITVDKYFGSCFDNNPYTKLLIWLPYIGYRELDPDECVGKSIHVIYHCDCMTGDCVAYVSTEAGEYGPVYSRVIAQFSGNCGVRVPFGTTSYDAAVAASVQLLGGAVGFAAMGATAGAGLAAGAIGASQLANSIQGSTIGNVNASKTATERSGTAGASAGYLSVQYPYLLKTVPQQSLPVNYKDLEGYPANLAGPLTKFSGFVGVETIDLNGIAATKSELDEILSLLREGVYI